MLLIAFTIIIIIAYFGLEPLVSRIVTLIKKLPRCIFLRIGWLMRGKATCTICLERLEESIYAVKKCGHRFHYNCIRDWLQAQVISSCPICRSLL